MKLFAAFLMQTGLLFVERHNDKKNNTETKKRKKPKEKKRKEERTLKDYRLIFLRGGDNKAASYQVSRIDF